MNRYRLVYIETRTLDSGKATNIPVEDFVEVPLDFVSEDYNYIFNKRMELCAKMNFGYVKIVEED